MTVSTGAPADPNRLDQLAEVVGAKLPAASKRPSPNDYAAWCAAAYAGFQLGGEIWADLAPRVKAGYVDAFAKPDRAAPASSEPLLSSLWATLALECYWRYPKRR